MRGRLVVLAAAMFGLPAAAPVAAVPIGPHAIYATIVRVAGADLVVQRRDGRQVTVDISEARRYDRTGVLYAHRPVVLYGALDRFGRYHANAVRTWYGLLRGVWPADH